jgi:hypothetical protein
MQHEGLLLDKHDCCGCWKSYVHEKLDFHISSWFWRESLRQQQPSGRKVAFLSVHVNLCCVDVGCMSISVPVLLNVWSQLVTNYNPFFRTHQWFCLINNLSQTQCDGPWHCKDACPTYSCLKINLCFGPFPHLKKFGREVFPHSVLTILSLLLFLAVAVCGPLCKKRRRK